MTQDPRAFGLPARHDEELDRIGRAIAGMNETFAAIREMPRPAIAGEPLAVERCRRNGFADVPVGMGRREEEDAAVTTTGNTSRAGSPTEQGRGPARPLSAGR